MDQRRKAYDCFPQLVIPDEFMRRVIKKQDWTLVDPYEVRVKLGIELAELWGEKFNEAYALIESELGNKITLYKRVNARELFKDIMRSQLETGMPYLAFKDTINEANPGKNEGIISQVNLCVAGETRVLTDKGQIAIADIVGQTVTVWNGFEWSDVLIKKTGDNQHLVTVTVEDNYGRTKKLDCTDYHKWHILRNGQIEIISTSDLKIGDISRGHNLISDLNPEILESGSYFEITEITDNNRFSTTYCFEEPKRHLAVFNGILTGNCTESFSNTKPNELAHVCNLVSLNLANLPDSEIPEACYTAVRLLDNTIDLTLPPLHESKAHNDRYRTIGVGAMGLADWLAKNHLRYENLNKISGLFEEIGYHCTNASMELAKERGVYPAFPGSEWSKGLLIGSKPVEWFLENAHDKPRWAQLSEDIKTYGIRNSHITAIAPNTSSALVQGCTASILPVYGRFFYDKGGKGAVPIAPPFIKDCFWFYPENKTLNQTVVVNAVSVIQQWIDTGISMELLFNLNEGVYFPDDPTRALSAKDIYETLVLAWETGCKAVYYVRTVQKDNFKDSESSCTACAN